jgi:DNA polymerase-3 subunit delta'
MNASEILGHEAPLELLGRARDSGRLPHALLFHGPDGVGKGTVARALAAALLCERGGREACGECGACRKTRHGHHPDLLFVRRLSRAIDKGAPLNDPPQDERPPADLSAEIRIFQIRELAQHAAFAPREGPCRVFIIDPADRMNLPTQSALLKTLEEPPGQSYLILIASRPHLLLSTVRSRSFVVGFAPMPAASLAARLEQRGMPRDEALARAALAGGRPGRALSLELDALQQRREQLAAALIDLAASPEALAELPALATAVAGKSAEDLSEGLDLVEGLLRDAARASTGATADSLLHADLSDRMNELGRALGAERAAQLVETVERLRGELRFNINRTLLAESLLAAVAGAPLP